MIHAAPMGGGAGMHSRFGAVHTGGSRVSSGPRLSSTPHTASAFRHAGAPSTLRNPGAGSVAARGGHNPGAAVQRNAGLQGQLNGRLANNRLPGQNWTTRSLHGVGQASMLRNGAFASLAAQHIAARPLGDATFHGRFAGANWNFANGGWFWPHWWHPIVVIGWLGPLFWPYAYDDFIDYTFWPYAYDAFWPCLR